jgi:hypothetical protein
MDKLTNKQWWKAAGTRAIKTFAQTALVTLPATNFALGEVSWVLVGSIATSAAVVSLLNSLAGLPELKEPVVTGRAEGTE